MPPAGKPANPAPRLPLTAVAMVLLASQPLVGADPADPAALDFGRDIRPLLTSYCYPCHDAKESKGELDLQRFADVRSIQLDATTWLEARRYLDEHEMPPAKHRQPSSSERTRLSLWIQWAIDNVDPALVPKDPGAVVLHRLTKTEFDHTYRDLLGVKPGLAKGFPDDIGGTSGFDNSADSLSLSSLMVEKLLLAASDGLEQASPTRLFVRQPPAGALPAKEARELAKENLAAFAARAWRRPLKPRELDQLLLIFDLYARKKSQPWEVAMRQMYRQVLVAPAFIYRAEELRPAERAPYEIGQYDLASRLSYFLWSSMPDDALFALAAAGELHKPEVIAAQVARMLQDPRAQAFGDRFVGQWLDTAALRRGGGPDQAAYPRFTEQVRQSMCDEPGRFFMGLVADDGSLLDLIDCDYVWVNGDTAPIYGVRGVSGPEFRKVPRPGDDRGGVVAMPAVLALTSYAKRTSPVLRGSWVLTHLLGAPAPPPPPDVPSLDQPPAGGRSAREPSLRERLTAHRADPACASCHSRIDPLGFGLEGYDAIGAARSRDEHGNALDLTGTLLTGESFTGAAELKRVLMKRRDAVMRLVVEQLLAFALGRKLEPFDRPVVGELTRNLAADRYRVRGLITAIASSYPMRFKRNQAVLAAGASK